MTSRAAPSSLAAAAVLAAIGGLHVVWATGSSWPAKDAEVLSGSVAGRKADDSFGPVACLSVAGLLGVASGLFAGYPRQTPRLRRLGAAGVITVLSVRGGFGLAGRTDALVPGSASERFKTLDRRCYSPLCLAIAVAAIPAVKA